MNEERIQAIKNQLRELMLQITQMGEEPPEEVQYLLLQVIEHFTQEIQRLRGEENEPNIKGTGQIEPIPKLDSGPFPSSNVNSFKYDPRNGTLFVKFHGQDSADSGPVYKYQNVPKYIYDVFSKGRVGPKTSGQNQYHRWIEGVTPSLGASLNALIKEGGYPYQRMS